MFAWILTTHRELKTCCLACLALAIYVSLVFFLRDAKQTRNARISIILRLVAAFLATWLALAPELTYTRKTRAPIMIVLDASLSMDRRVDGVALRRTELELATILEEEARARNLETRVCALDGLEVSDAASALNRADQSLISPLQDASRFRNTGQYGAVFLFSDGIGNPPVSSVPNESTSSRVALHTLALGSATKSYDLEVAMPRSFDEPQDASNASRSISLAITGGVPLSKREVKIQIWRLARDSRLIWSQDLEITLDDQGKGAATSSCQNLDENQRYLLLAVDVSGEDGFPKDAQDALDWIKKDNELEVCRVNNAFVFDTTRRNRVLRALVVEEQPRDEFRYLCEILKQDRSVDLTTVLLSADKRVVQDDPNALELERLDRTTLASYDVIIVGDVTENAWRVAGDALVNVVARDASRTSLWFLGARAEAFDERTQSAVLSKLFRFATQRETKSSGAPWTLETAPSGRALYGDEFADALTSQQEQSGMFSLRLYDVPTDIAAQPGAEVLLQARQEDSSLSIPVLLVATFGSNKVAWQSSDEMWRLQTLENKDVYRSYVARTLDFLTETPEISSRENHPRDGVEELSDLSEDNLQYFYEYQEVIDSIKLDSETKRKHILEEKNLASSIVALKSLSDVCGGRTLDLRDLPQEEILERARQFFGARLNEITEVATQRRVSLAPLNLLIPLILTALILIWMLESKKTARKTNST